MISRPARGLRGPAVIVMFAVGTAILSVANRWLFRSDRKAVALHSGLVLHDIGTGDGIAQESAQWNEMRTQPLWGLRLRLD